MTAAFLSSEDVSLKIRDAVATITVGRPQKLNAMRLESWHALRAQIAAAEGNPEVALIVVRGSGKHFGAGNDIAELSSFRGKPSAAKAFASAMADAVQSVEDAAKPVLMAIEGICYGAALALALAGDLRLASANAVFSIPAAKLGILYLRSDLHRLVAAIGMGQSKKLLYSAEAVPAARAEHIGLVDEVIPEDRFEPELQRLIATVLAGSPFTLQRTKKTLRGLVHGPTPGETNESLAAFVEATQSIDFDEGVTAFLARRTPSFHRLGEAI